MRLLDKRWRRPAWGLLTVGVVVAIGYCVGSAEQFKRFLLSSTTSADTAAQDNHDGESEHDHGHGHAGDEPTVATTIWAEKADIFLERPYPIAGQPIEMLVHVTVIRDGSAVTEGSLTLHAIGPDRNVVEVCVDEPARPGIFIPEATFPKPGKYQARLVVETSQLEGGRETIELPTIEVYASSDATLAAAEESHEEEPGDLISFLKEQQWRVGVTTVEATEQELVERLVVPGRVIVPPGSGAAVSSPIGGKVSPPEDGRFVQVGEKVHEGQVLGVIEPSVAGAEAVQLVANQAQLQTLDADLVIKQLDIETQIKNAELTVSRATEVYHRKQRLSEQGIMPGKDLLLAEHELALARGRLAGLTELRRPYSEARERLAAVLGRMQSSGDVGHQPGDLRVTLRSPIAGTVVEINATSGELVDGRRQLFRIVDLDKLWIEANVSEYDLAKVQRAPGASYRLAAYPDRVVPILEGGGRLIDIGAEVDPDTRTIPIRYEVTNGDGSLRVGMFADLLVETQRRHEALAVPKSAVMDEAGETVVYVQHGGESFQRRRVEVGIRDAELVEICLGLQPGERVATKGVYPIRLATLSKQSIGHGHAH
ncbi:MAG: efflux RND transporter periplasmic adaptor subunit [Planctomycetes bacterium]|nr:efflux RND transporter periplasmic adaptor subunit [Planctomycetota bacterium]MBL7039135.1 efflux RND transporter periplasmic adaptor subunit [Pirellulaceae bacterium]